MIQGDGERHVRSSGSRWLWPAAWVIAGLVFVATYANSLHNSFQFDDGHVIQTNIFIRSLGNIPRFFSDASTFSSVPLNTAYRPLVTTSLAIDYAIGGGLDPVQFHRTQLLLLAVLGVMLSSLFRRMFDFVESHPWNRYAALGAALLFTIHTVNTETANYISARSEILSTMGIVGSFLVYLVWPPLRRTQLYLLPMVVGVFAKEPAVMFAPLFFVYVYMFEEQAALPALFTRSGWASFLRALRRSIPAFIAGAGGFAIIQLMHSANASYGGGSRLHYAFTQAYVWVHYARLFFLPIGLTADTDLEPIQVWYDTRVVVGVVFIALLILGIAKASAHRTMRPVAFGLAWFGIGLLPSSSVVPLAEMANEHRVFLPYIGLVAAAAWLLVRELRARVTARPDRTPTIVGRTLAAAACVFAVLAYSSHERNKVWATDGSFWADVVAKSPRNGRAQMNYGLVHLREGRFAEAKAAFDFARTILPNYATLEVNLGIVTDMLGNAGEAEAHFTRALQLQPNSAETHFYYARWLVAKGRANEAIRLLRDGIAVSPATIDARSMLMSLYYACGRDQALDTLARATLAIAPQDSTAIAYVAGKIPLAADTSSAETLFKYGLGAMGSGDNLRAAVFNRRAVIRDPGNADYLNNFAWSLAKLGFYEESVPIFESAIRIRPNYALAINNLAWARSQIPKKP